MSGSERTEAAVVDAPAPPRVARAEPRGRRATGPKVPAPTAVVLHNDDINGFAFVVRTLEHVFGYGSTRAAALTLRAHVAGRSVVWTGHREHAEFKADRLRSAGPDPAMRARGAAPLRVTVETLGG